MIQVKDSLFTLHTAHTTYQFAADGNGFLLHTYYGPRAEGDFRRLLRFADRGFSPNPNALADGRVFSLDTLPQEYPASGVGDFRVPVIEARFADGSAAVDLRFERCEVRKGKYALEGLPAFRGEEAETLAVYLRDPCTGLSAELLYGVLEDSDLITRAVRITNGGSAPVTLTNAGSLCLDFARGDMDVITFDGRHTMERIPHRRAVAPGVQSVGSGRGITSHQHNNFVVLCDHDATETSGVAYGAALVYSGNFRTAVERSQFDHIRLVSGISPQGFSWTLAPGETFTAPEAAMACSSEGLGGMSRIFHAAIRSHLCRGEWTHKPRPVLLNTWEAFYFDFTADEVVEAAKAAADAGVELLVLDDGWFGNRCDDRRGLGDWFVNEEKLPGGLAPLAKRIGDLGLAFGLWIEPEMVSEDSELYRAHPDWALRIPGRPATMGRSQLVLDFSRPEVRDAVYAQLCKVLRSADIRYVKWDMNRSLTDVWSAALPAGREGEAAHRWMLGVYDLLERFTRDFPHILLEGCCGGGGRFDCGILYYSPQIWTSDNTDAADRLLIQYGTSFGYPVSAMGAHVSAVPNEQTHRTLPFETRGVVAMSGTFGYELDPRKLTPEERADMRSQIARFRELYDLLQNGEYDRLTDPRSGLAAWQQTAPDKSEALVNVVTGLTRSNDAFLTVYPRRLDAEAVYSVNGEWSDTGAALMYGGIPLPQEKGDFRAMQFHLVREDA